MTLHQTRANSRVALRQNQESSTPHSMKYLDLYETARRDVASLVIMVLMTLPPFKDGDPPTGS